MNAGREPKTKAATSSIVAIVQNDRFCVENDFFIVLTPCKYSVIDRFRLTSISLSVLRSLSRNRTCIKQQRLFAHINIITHIAKIVNSVLVSCYGVLLSKILWITFGINHYAC